MATGIKNGGNTFAKVWVTKAEMQKTKTLGIISKGLPKWVYKTKQKTIPLM